jgi:hypothetical protein
VETESSRKPLVNKIALVGCSISLFRPPNAGSVNNRPEGENNISSGRERRLFNLAHSWRKIPISLLNREESAFPLDHL